MRRSFDGLSAMVCNHMGADPTGGHWFVFVNRRRTLLKVLAFDGDGYWIWSKRLEAGQFAAPGRSADGQTGTRQRVAFDNAHGPASAVGRH